MSSCEPDRFLREFSRALKEAREKKGVSQRQLAVASKVGRSGIVAIEAGGRMPSVFLCKQLADGLGIPLAELVATVEERLRSKRR